MTSGVGRGWRVMGRSAQIETDLPPQVEVTIHEQPSAGATLVHFVNSSGHQDRSFHAALPVFDRTVGVRVDGAIRSVYSAAFGTELEFEQADGRVRMKLPRLDLLELLVLT